MFEILFSNYYNNVFTILWLLFLSLTIKYKLLILIVNQELQFMKQSIPFLEKDTRFELNILSLTSSFCDILLPTDF